jgi:N-acetylmuramoyl-L-alanine amidase
MRPVCVSTVSVDNVSRLVLSVLLVGVTALVFAQPSSKLLRVGGFSLRAVFPPGSQVAYADAGDLAEALGLQLQVAQGAVTLVQGGRILRITLLENVAASANYGWGLYVNGSNQRGQAAGYQAGQLLLPVRTVANGLEASLTDDGQGLALTLPAVKLQTVRSDASSEGDRVVFEFTRDVGYSVRLEGKEAVLDFPAASGDEVNYEVGGTFVKTVEVRRGQSLLEARVPLADGAGFSTYARPASSGAPARVVLNVSQSFARPEVQLQVRKVRVVLDPSGGGADAGVTVGDLREKELMLAVVRLIGRRLADAGVEVRYTRNGDANTSLSDRRQASLSSDVFMSFSLAGLNASSGSGTTIMTLAPEAAREGLVAKARAALETETDQARRRLLSDVVTLGGASALLAEPIQNRLLALAKPSVATQTPVGQTPAVSDPAIPGLSVQSLVVTREAVLELAPKAAAMIELGWLSSETDRVWLSAPESMRLLAETISDGVLEYLAPVLNSTGANGTDSGTKLGGTNKPKPTGKP